MKRFRLVFGVLTSLAAVAGCSGDEDRSKKGTDVSGVSSTAAESRPWAFVDAFAALKSADPKTRFEGVEWIGRHLITHAALAREALRAAAADDDPAVAGRAKHLLRRLGQ